MANEGFPDAPASPDLRALEARIQQLELDLAALRRQVGATAAPQPEKNAPPPPPAVEPVPDRVPQSAATWPPRPRLTSMQWQQLKHPAPEAANGKPQAPRESLESRLGSQYFNRIAIVLLLIGTAYGMKLAVDRGLIGPAPRVILGLLAGAALVVWSERFRRKGFATFSYSLKALGSGVLYLALWAAFRLYGLIPAPAALVLMILVTAWNAYMAWAQDAELLAGYALAGGFATPMLLSTGGNHEIFLFTYLLAMDVATVTLVRLRGWSRLLLAAFPLTVAYLAGWYFEYFGQSEPLGVTCLFLALFAAVFASVPIGVDANGDVAATGRAGSGRAGVLREILLPLANACFAALAGYGVLQDSGHHAWLPWMMVVLAAAYLALMRLPQRAVASAMHLSIAIVFLTIAIPLKASGHWITVSWLVEGLALTWVATRLPDGDETTYAANTLRRLAWGSLLLGLCGIAFHVVDGAGLPSDFLSGNTGTALVGIAAFACASWLAMTAAAADAQRDAAWMRLARNSFGAISAVAVLLSLREFVTSWDTSRPHAAFATADFATALLSLAVFAGVIAVSARVARERPADEFWRKSAAGATIAFNLVAVLTGVREVDAMWAPAPNAWTSDAALQQSLAISGFLMLYGAVLLAVGFWKRSSFLRWQALALLVFTVFKAFLYDMRNLSQGYRVVSLMGLGALLLAVSFAYQKDWLNLKTAEPADQDESS